ncbi:MAG TPA: DUF3300 domain-containing protein [Verrucomicrobiae bacterium]|nr:DUF3300 domain-containing protein [Verrucomicrobiae bacterium]
MLGHLVRCALVAGAGLFLCAAAPAQAQDDAAAQEAAATLPAFLGPDELRRVVAPVAFYSDDLLAIVLPAATNPLQIVEAQRFLTKRKKDQKLEPNAEWDPSILALINYPEVIEKMNADLEWTKALGNAVIDQLDDVLDMIQQLRAEAANSGYLQANEFQVVYWLDDYWYIDSSDPDYIYIPDYPPDHPIFNPPDGVRPEPPIALPPDASIPHPEHPIALPPGAVLPHPAHPIAYPPPVYVSHQPYWSPGAMFVAGAIVGGAFGYGFDWNNSEIDINVGADCCRGGNVDIGDRNRVDHRTGDRFNADKQWANGKDKLKWNPNKARQKQAAGVKKNAGRSNTGTLPAKQPKTGAAKQPKLTNPALRNQGKLSGDTNLRGEKKSSLGNYSSSRESSRTRDQGSRSLNDSRSNRSGSSYDRSRSRSNSGAFGGYNRGSTTRMQSSRGSRSMGGMRGGGRGGGRR